MKWNKIKKFNDNLYNPITAILIMVLVGVLCIVIIIVFINENGRRKHIEILNEQRANTISEISKIDEENLKLNSEVHSNILEIYNRIKVISDESPDEIRDKVISSVDLEGAPLTVEASIVALLKTYEEFQNDPEVQVYLNENVTIMDKIEDNNKIKDSLIEFLQELVSYDTVSTETILDAGYY